MDRGRYERIQQLFDRALDVATSGRKAFLDRECRDDRDLRAEVASLLKADDSAGGFLEDSSVAHELARREQLDKKPEERDDLGPGSIVGAWRLMDVIGSGGMGQVWRAERAVGRFTQKAALKVVKRGMDSEEILARFRNERQTLAGLEHPFIARLLDGGVTSDGRPFLGMELIEGERIDRWCARLHLDLAHRLELFGKVCRAVEHAHQHLVVHRDLKPGNILVNRDGDPKLLDFGIAKVLDAGTGADSTGVTQPGSRVFTLDYASPEQVQGKPVTTASDVYSLGLVLYELLTGSRAYDLRGRDFIEIERIVCHELPTPPSASKPGDDFGRREGKRLRGDLDNIVLKALRKEPERRYATVAELREDLERFGEGLPVRAAPETTTYLAKKFFLRHRAESVFAALAIVSLMGGLVLSLRMLGRARTAEAAEREKAQAEQKQRERAELQLGQKREALAFFSSLIGAGDVVLGKGPHTTLQEMLVAASGRLLKNRQLEPDVEAEIRQMLGLAWHNAGELERAEEELARAAELFATILAPEHPDRLDVRRHLASLRAQRGRGAEAVKELQEIADLSVKQFGADSGRALDARCDLCVALLDLGRAAEGAALAKEIAAAYAKPSLGTENAHTTYRRLWIGHNLALALYYSHELESAEPIARRVYEEQSRAFSPTHDLTLLTLHTLAAIESERGNLDRAEADFRTLLDARTKYFSNDHPQTQIAKADLAIVLARRGKFEDALVLQREVLAAQRGRLGPTHRDTLITNSNVVNTLRDLGKFEEACDEVDIYLPRIDVAFPDKSDFRVWMHWIAGETYSKGDRFEEALEQLEIAWDEHGGEAALRDPARRGRAIEIAQSFCDLYEAWDMPDELETWKGRASPLPKKG